MLKKILFAAAALVLAGAVWAEPAPIAIINGSKAAISSMTVGEGGHVMVALRDLEKIGWGSVGSANGETTFTDGKVTLAFVKNSKSAKLNSLKVNLPVAAYLSNGKLMVPFSFVAKSLGYDYNAERIMVVETSGKAASQPAAVKETVKTSAPAAETVKPSAAPETVSGTNPGGKNWFQGCVAYNGRKISGVKLTLKTDPGAKTVKTVTSDKDGQFVVYNIPDGKYQIVIDNNDNPDYKSIALSGLAIKGGAAKKLNKNINLVLALNNCTVTKDGEFYEVKWSNVNNVKFYKLKTKCANKNAKVPVYTTTKNSYRIPASELSKGQIYDLELMAITAANLTIAQSNGKNWVLSTQN